MDFSTAIFTSIGFLSLVSLALGYKLLSKFCRRQEASLPTVSRGNMQSGGAEQGSKCVQVATSSPRLCFYKNRRLLASFPSLDRFLNTVGWQEGVTLESGLADPSIRGQDKATTLAERQQPGHTAPHNQDDNGRKLNQNQDTEKAANNGPGSHTSSSGTTVAGTQTSSGRVNSCTTNPAHSILNIVSAIPSISIGSFSQSLPNVHGYLAESVSTSSGSRDLVVLWSTTLESCNSGVLTSTRLE